MSRYDAQPERYGLPAPPDNEQFLNGLEQGGTFEHVSLGLQRVLDRLNTA